ncbi:AmmeMemoRadiSam system protein A [bacterium]|nr:AmmeMemoRadiSam system protein A [bacterium]
MNTKEHTFYRAGGAFALLVLGVLIVVWAARSHLSRRASNPLGTSSPHLLAEGTQEIARRGSLSDQEWKFLLGLARKTIEEVVIDGNMPEIDASGLSNRLTELKGCFVTLKEKGQLRGCIGHIFPNEPLYKAVMDNARSAAISDPRFPPVQSEELAEIEIEVSVLTVPQPLDFESPDDLLNKLRPDVDGVVLRIGRRQSTFLPQVWEQLPDKERFLAHLTAKAGLPPRMWKEPGTAILTYQVEAFKESEM